MTRHGENVPSRRDFLKVATISAAALGPFFLFPDRALASQKTLKIAKWAHFISGYDSWFENELAQEWGKKHDTKVVVDFIPAEQIGERAAAEVRSGKGHDVFIFPWPPAEYHRHVIDHGEIYQTVAFKYGTIDRLAHRSTFFSKAKKYFAFCDSWIPLPLHFFEDDWGEVGMPLGPVHYGGLRSGGQRIREKLGIPCGLAMTPNLEGNVTLHTLLVAFGGAVLDVHGNVILNIGARTIEALKYVKSLYQDAGASELLAWGSSGNVRAMLERKTSCTSNAISLLRAAEKQEPRVAGKIRLQPPLLGSAGSGILAVPHVTNCSAVWNFAENPEGAKQFLADLIDDSRTGYEKSQGCNFPIYQKTVPDLIVRLENDPQGDPPYKYKELKDALYWTHNLGVPGYATPAFMEVFNTFVIPKMFMSVVRKEASSEDAAAAAAKRVKEIAEKWNQA
ncbi:MAG TPA: ABC transporter substrate-binding protein [Candidatus Acidoferrales bacterium]|nr:ABC transporter substrate-binding protein [Candidatus Acidoferrales bacterium]